ncbi:MAG: F0F1 ATP synthase subunit A [candidate division Zixibacteria bacterium]|nr:F0F1 ATP synthase subunit A [candidate division Zixibacteria bacterium]
MIEKTLIYLNTAVVRTAEHANEAAEHAADTAYTIAGHAADTLHVVAGHAAEAAAHGGHGGQPELPNWLELANILFPGSITDFLMQWHVPIFSLFATLFLSFFCIIAYRKRTLIPGKLQNFIEYVVESLSNMVIGIIGESGRRYIPFLGTLFIYIFAMNILGLFPGMFSSTSKLNTTLALAICVFLFVQFEGIRVQGFFGYFYHFMGSPKSVVEWCLVPLNFPIHIIGELAKPISLSLRLFGNISGEDMLLAIFVGLGIAITMALNAPAWVPGLPLQLPFIFLALLTSFVQALVFTLLSTIYFSLMTTHEEEEHH